MDLDLVVKIAGGIGTIAGAALGVMSLVDKWKPGRRILLRGLMICTAPLHGAWTILWMVTRLQGKVDVLEKRSQKRDSQLDRLDREMAKIVHEMGPNDWGSISDRVMLITGIVKQWLRETPLPQFVCTDGGRNLLVSDAYCELLGIENDDRLLKLDWQSFIFQEDFEEYFAHFERMVQTRSVFRGVARFVDSDGNPIGRWQVLARPMLHGAGTRLLYKGVLSPLDALAREKWQEALSSLV